MNERYAPSFVTTRTVRVVNSDLAPNVKFDKRLSARLASGADDATCVWCDVTDSTLHTLRFIHIADANVQVGKEGQGDATQQQPHRCSSNTTLFTASAVRWLPAVHA